MTTERARIIAGGLLALWLLAVSAWAIDTPNERITLQGLAAIHVVFDEIGAEGEREGLTRAILQPEVEQRLLRGGLRVRTPTEALAAVGRPTLHLRVTLRRVPQVPDLYLYGVDVTLQQRVRLVRDSSIESAAVTWSENRVVGTARTGQLGVVRDAVLLKVDQFVTAWQVSNRGIY